MKDAVYALRRWLRKNDIPTEGMEITLHFPSADARYRAEKTLEMEFDALMLYPRGDMLSGKAELCGVKLNFAGARTK